MRHIEKSNEPNALNEWKKKFKPLQDAKWNSLNVKLDNNSLTVKRQIAEELLKEQGYICCYCEVRLQNHQFCHIEHFKPRNKYRKLAFDYSNMLGCCFGGSPGKNRNKKDRLHCGQSKGSNELHSLSPLDPDICLKLEFLDNGRIDPAKNIEKNKLINKDIKILNLNSINLRRSREAAIKFLKKQPPIQDKNYLISLIEKYQFKDNGMYLPFSSAVVYYLIKQIDPEI